MHNSAEWCVHFNGLANNQCKVDVTYHDVRQAGDNGYWHYPCFADPQYGTAGVGCALARFPTPEEVAAREAEIEAAANQFFADIAADVCPHCKTPITKKRQVGRCVYAEPCGCRLYQGRLAKGSD